MQIRPLTPLDFIFLVLLEGMFNKIFSRRQFIKTSVLAVVFAPVLFMISRENRKIFAAQDPSDSIPPGMSEVLETDPVASAIGYKKNIRDIDYKKYPQRKKTDAKNQFCKNCALYTPVNGGFGKCQMLTSGVVTSQCWCGSWSKKS